MPVQSAMENGILLESLNITGFRGISSLAVQQLGTVTLITGKNGVGKTSVLDAVRILAGRGRFTVLRRILRAYEEFLEIDEDDDNHLALPDLASLFHRGLADSSEFIRIGVVENDRLDVTIRPGVGLRKLTYQSLQDSIDLDEPLLSVLCHGNRGEVSLNADRLSERTGFTRTGLVGADYGLRFRRLDQSESPIPEIPCVSMGPNSPSTSSVIGHWSRIALTEAESSAAEALQLIYGQEVERVAAVESGSPGVFRSKRMIVKLKGQINPVPLRSLGEGAYRSYSLALAIVSNPGSLLLIDEFENGIHYSAQGDLWRLMLETARANRVQVIATTHSLDCIRGFAAAVSDMEDHAGALVRVEREYDQLRAVEYSPRSLDVAARQGIEVR